ncbi:MAG: hypothetical protein PF450_09490, partial [Bacteroidales bacterium]|nr:hypothetical protein [Bacteroidales bacterium]
MSEFVNSVISNAVAPCNTKVLQAWTDNTVVGEAFEFNGQRAPQKTEDFKKECRKYYPTCKFRVLKNAASALGAGTW